MIGFTFDSYSLQSTSVITTDPSDLYAVANKTLQAEKLAEADGSVIVKQTYESKKFTLAGYLKAADIPSLELLIDTFKTALNKSKKNFDFDYAGGTRRFVATPQTVIINRPQGLNNATWSVEFFCESPVSMDTSTSILASSTTFTSSTYLLSVTVGGSYKAEPIITLTLNSGSGLTTNKTITLANNTNLRGISVTRNWAAGDVLEINSLDHTVYVNNVSVASSGLYPTWDAGAGGISYTDDFTSRNVTLSAIYTQRYL